MEKQVVSIFMTMPSDSFKDIMFSIRMNYWLIGFDGLESKQGVIIPENTVKTAII